MTGVMDYKPSYMRDQRNSCKTCVGFTKDRYVDHCGVCNKDNSLCCGEMVDTTFRCPAFQRREDILGG